MLMGDAYKSNTPLRHTVFTRRLLYGLTRNLDVTTAWPHALYVVTYYFIYTEKSRTGKYVLFVLFALVHQSASDSSGFSSSLSPLSFGRATASPSRMTG